MNAIARRFARVAVSSAIAVLATSTFAAPAFADNTADLSIKLAGTTFGADGVMGYKFGTLSIGNAGPSDASGVTIAYDLSELNADKVGMDLVDWTMCSQVEKILTCRVSPGVEKGADVDRPLNLIFKDRAPGSAGKIKVTVAHEGTDPDQANNSATADVVVAGQGINMSVVSPDVYGLAADGVSYTTDRVAPGAQSRLYAYVANQGRAHAQGIVLDIALPAGASFTEPEPECTHAIGDATTTCTYGAYTLHESMSVGFYFAIKVAADVSSPALLAGGVVTVSAVSTPTEVARSAPAATPDNVVKAPADLDPSNDTDEFGVFVGVASGLPVTGVQVGLISAAGLGVLGLGVALVVVTRRRRAQLADIA